MCTANAVIRCSWTFSSFGLSPGAWSRLYTVSADVWVTERTVAAHKKGSPSVPDKMANDPIIIKSRW